MLIDVMLHYACRNWALVPMRGKIFAFRGKVRDAATRDPRVIETWTWAEGVGLACGEPSNVDVLDVDDPAQFPLDLAALLAATLHATTPRGGFHLLFKFAGLRSRPFEWGEWRSTNLAIVLPLAPGRRWANNLPTAEAPPELIEFVRRPLDSASTAFLPGPQMAGASGELPKPLYLKVIRLVPLSAQVTRHDQRRVIGILNIALRRQRRRNDGINVAGFCLRELVHDGIVSPAAAEELLFDVAVLNGYVAKDGVDAARATIRSSLSH